MLPLSYKIHLDHNYLIFEERTQYIPKLFFDRSALASYNYKHFKLCSSDNPSNTIQNC